MNEEFKKEVEKLIKKYDLNCSIEEFKDNTKIWFLMSQCKCLPEDFIRKFQDKVNWKEISAHRVLSEKFIKEFKHKLDLKYLLEKNKINWKFYNHLNNYKYFRRYEILDI